MRSAGRLALAPAALRQSVTRGVVAGERMRPIVGRRCEGGLADDPSGSAGMERVEGASPYGGARTKSADRSMLAADSLPALVEVASALACDGRFLDAGDCLQTLVHPNARPLRPKSRTHLENM